MAWLPDGEKISKISSFVLAQPNERDRQMDGHRMPAIAVLMYSIARQNYAENSLAVFFCGPTLYI